MRHELKVTPDGDCIQTACQDCGFVSRNVSVTTTGLMNVQRQHLIIASNGERAELAANLEWLALR